MKRGGPLPRNGTLSARKALKRVSDKRRRHYASAEGKAGLAHMARVKGLPCVICGAPPPSEAHHVICGRYGTRKASDTDTIPLCPSCHRTGPGAIHAGKSTWEATHGPDYGFLPVVRAMLAEIDDEGVQF